MELWRPRPSCCPLIFNLLSSPLTSEPTKKKVIIRVGQGRQDILNIFSELERKMPVDEFLTPSLGLSAPRFGNHLSFAVSLSLTVAWVGGCVDKGKMEGRVNRWVERKSEGSIDRWMDGSMYR